MSMSSEQAARRRARINADPELRAEELAKRSAWSKQKMASDPDYREKLNAYNRKRYATPEGKRAASEASLLSKYGITIGQRDALLAFQGGRCALPHCQANIVFGGRGIKRTTAHVDHCHTTGRVRGILCGPCNTALGKLGDCVASVLGVLDYLHGRLRVAV